MGILLLISVILASIAILIVAAILIPVKISLKLEKEGLLAQVWLSFGILMGTASGRVEFSSERREFQLQLFSATLLRKPLEKEKEKKPEEKKPTDWKKIVGNADELYRAGMDLVGALTKSISIQRLRGKVHVGLPDAAQTGLLVGALYAGGGIAQAFLPETSLQIEPSFEEEKMDATIKLDLNLSLLKIIIPLTRFLWRMRKIFKA